MAFCVLPWPSAYSKSVMFGHLATSFLADAVVTRRQLLPPKPSVRPRVAFFGPHHDGRFPPPEAAAGVPLVPDPVLPQPVRSSVATPNPAMMRRSFLEGRMCRFPFFVTSRSTGTGMRGRQRWAGTNVLGIPLVFEVRRRTGRNHVAAAGDGVRDGRSRCRAAAQSTLYKPTPSASAAAWTKVWMAKSTPRARTNCWSWVRNSAANAVATMFPFPPSSEVPPSTTAATDGNRYASPWNAVG